MQEIDNYKWTEYYILPVHKKVRFIPIKTKETLEVIIKDYQGQNVKVEFSELQKPENEKLRWGLLHVHFLKIKFFLLSNGMIAVDRSEQTKATPYFICPSIDDFRLIADYLLMYFIDDGSFIVECIINFDQFAIKRFLEKEQPELIKERSDDIRLLFKTTIGKYVQVEYFDKRRRIASGFDSYLRDNPELQNEAIIYYHLAIYDSLEIMNKLGKFDKDYFEIDEENFESHKQKLFISESKSIKVTILNQKDASLAIEDAREIIPEKFNADYQKTFVGNRGEIIAQYSPYIYIYFLNQSDFETYLLHLKKELGDGYEREPQFEYFPEKIKRALDQKLVYSNLFEVDAVELTLGQFLKMLDRKINKFFFDNFLIKKYLPELAVRIGNIIIQKEGGDWKYDEAIKRMLIITDSGKIDFTPHLYKELLRQKYTGFCPTEGMIGGLLVGSRLKIIKSFGPKQN